MHDVLVYVVSALCFAAGGFVGYTCPLRPGRKHAIEEPLPTGRKFALPAGWPAKRVYRVCTPGPDEDVVARVTLEVAGELSLLAQDEDGAAITVAHFRAGQWLYWVAEELKE